MWSRSLLRPLPKLCRARGLVKPRYSTFCDRSLYENGTFHAAQDDSSYHLPALDDARSRTLATSHDNLHPLANDRAPREGLSSGLQSSNGSPADGQPAQSAASRKVGSDMQYDETGLEVTAHDDRSISFNMSNAARSITGVARFKLCVRQPGDGHLRGPTTYAERLRIMRMLDHQIQQSHTLGLGALASAVRAVDKTLQDGQRVLLFGPGMTKATITADGPLDYGFHVRFRKDHGLCGTQIKHLFIYVFGNYNEDSAVESQSKSGPIQFDLKHLQQTADMVIERIRDAMSFHEPEALLKTIAESMLRVLRFRTPHLGIKGVSMTTRPASEEQPRLKVHACWADAECGVPAEHDRLSKAVEVNVKQVPRGNPLAEQENDVDEEESEEMISAAPDAEKSSPQPKQEESVHLTIPLPLVPVSGGKELLFDSGEVKTKSLWRFGMSRYKIMLRWPIAANLPHDLTRDLVKQATENAIQKTSGVDCAALSHAVQTLQTSLPSCPLVTLQVFDEARAKSQKLEMDPHASLFAFRTTPERKRKGLWELALIGMPISNARIADAASDQIVEMDMRLCFGAHPAANMAGHDRLEQQRYDMTLAAMELLRPVLQASSRITWEEFANDCVGSLSGAQLPVEGCPAIDHVAIQVFTASVHDGPRRTLRGSATSSSQNSTAMVALGSNLGNRIANIEAACRRLEADPDINIVGTSLLYETKAMYVEEQAAFVNGMCKIRTDLPPFDLLNRLQSIENELGRVKLIDKGPRNIDLDIATYARDSIDSERLTVPHKQMLEREFVLRPYCDIHPTYVHPRTGRRMENHLVELMSGESTMYPFTPLAPECEPLRALEPTRRTWLMSILNVTPDSFSDGGSHEPTDMDALRRTVNAHISAGVTIIDIGGQSSRPNAPDVSPDEEISRILPAIEVIKSIPEAKHIAISVDTYRAAVAKAAVHAGAHIINDISAGTLDDEMLPTIARLGCTYIMMHMRGTPATMQSEQNTSYPGGLIPTIANELRSRLIAALKAGIRPWRIIFDPGVGFAKTAEQNAELLGRFGELRNHPKLKNFPWLVGSSRKGFIGKFTGAEDPKDRTEGTAATVTAAIAGGAEIVRVHDVKEMSRVVKMADAMYRRAPPGPAAVEKAEDDRQEQLEIEARDEDMEDDEETETETKAEDEEQK